MNEEKVKRKIELVCESYCQDMNKGYCVATISSSSGFDFTCSEGSISKVSSESGIRVR